MFNKNINKEELEFLKEELKSIIILGCQAKYILTNDLRKFPDSGVTPEIIFGSILGMARYHIENNFRQFGGDMLEINEFEKRVMKELENERPSYTLENFKERIAKYVRR